MVNIIITSIFLGLGLAADACAISMADGMNEPKIKFNKLFLISLSFGFFQALMPFISYLVGSQTLTKIEWIIPWVALSLLSFLGIKMIVESRKSEEQDSKKLTFSVIMLQSIATSIDALTVGFSISNYSLTNAIITVLVIMFITTILCVVAFYLGKKFGTKFGKTATLIGGIILLLIGLEIFISSFFS